MPITVTVFILVCSLFALRGGVLGFISWLTKILGLIAGYLLAYSYRDDAAHIVSIYLREFSPLLLQVVCGISLFFAGTILVNMFISSIIDFLRKTNKSLNQKLKYKSRQGRITGAVCNGVLGAFVALLGIWGYGVAHSYQWVPALAQNNHAMQNIANKVGEASFGFLLETITATPSSTISLNKAIQLAPDLILPTMESGQPTLQAPATTLEELRQRANQKKQQGLVPSQIEHSGAEITLVIEDIQGIATEENPFLIDEAYENRPLEQLENNAVNFDKNAIATTMQNVLKNEKLLTSTLKQYMSEDQAKMASQQLQNMMKDPKMQAAMQENIQKLMNNPAAIQQMLQNRHQDIK
ncbi:MAG: hypothetical protein HRU20_01865 [Pseudomonadales bacterium]|nr:hypothetical protein [Pseudomonadales bacterium]